MNWQQKTQAIVALVGTHDFAIRCRKDGTWYASSSGVEIKKGSMLSSAHGNGDCPVDAIEAYWQELTDLERGEYIVIDAMRESRRAVRWNGFMWADVTEEATTNA